MVTDPITARPDMTIGEVDALCARFRISGLPVVDEDGTLVGICTNRDMRFEPDFDRKVSEVMTAMPLVVAREGVSKKEALELLSANKVEKLPIVDADNKLTGLITVKDFVKTEQYPNASKDSAGRLLVAAGIGTGEESYQRAAALVDAAPGSSQPSWLIRSPKRVPKPRKSTRIMPMSTRGMALRWA